jgi:hypothetical protein
MVLASLRSTFLHVQTEPSENADLHERIVAGVLGCFDAELFDSTGVFKSMWLVRMANVAQDTQGMIDLLMAEETPVRKTAAPVPRRRF